MANEIVIAPHETVLLLWLSRSFDETLNTVTCDIRRAGERRGDGDRTVFHPVPR